MNKATTGRRVVLGGLVSAGFIAGALGFGSAAGATTTASTGTVQGQVTSPSGTPVSGICVALIPAGGNVYSPAATGTTSGSGNYQFANVVPGSYLLFLDDSACGIPSPYAPEWYGGSFTPSGATAVAVTAGVTSTANQALTLGGVITGTVTDTAAHPLADICVTAYDTSDAWSGGEVFTGPNGSYRFTGVPSSSSITVSINQNCYFGGTNTPTAGDLFGAVQLSNVATSLGQTTSEGATALPAAGYIAGQVVDSSGNAVSGASLNATSTSGTTGGYGQTDSAGQYVLGHLPTGSYTVTVQGCGYCNFVAQTVSANVTAGSGTNQPTITMPTGFAVQGTVTNTSGQTLSGICVSASPTGGGTSGSPTNDTTDFAGDYTLSGLAPGTTYTLYFSDCSGGGYVSTTYPSAVGSGAAAGQYLTGYNATMHQLSVTAPSSAAAGSSVTISGSGYQAGETVSMYMGGKLLVTSPKSILVSSGGTWSAKATMPSLPGGGYILDVFAQQSGDVYKNVQLKAGLTFNPKTPVGGSTADKGIVKGLQAGEQVTLHLGSATGTVLGAPANAASTGTATVTFTAPATGTYTVYAVGNMGSTAHATLTTT